MSAKLIQKCAFNTAFGIRRSRRVLSNVIGCFIISQGRELTGPQKPTALSLYDSCFIAFQKVLLERDDRKCSPMSSLDLGSYMIVADVIDRETRPILLCRSGGK